MPRCRPASSIPRTRASRCGAALRARSRTSARGPWGCGRAKAGVADRIGRIAAGGDATVRRALDGEIPWEHCPQSGELFLNELYGQLDGQAPRVVSVRPRAEIAERPPRGRIARLHSGSWIE